MANPEGIQTLAETDLIDEVAKYKTNHADFSMQFEGLNKTQAIRVHYLENLRFDWEWVDNFYSDEHEAGHVLLRRRR